MTRQQENPFPDTRLMLACLSPIWLHCLTSKSPGSPQKPQRWDRSASRCGLPGFSGTAHGCVSMNGEHPASHSCNTPHTGATVCQFLLMWCNYMCALSMMSVLVCILQHCKKRVCICTCVVQWMTHCELLVICPGTHKNMGQELCVTPCAFTGLSATYTTCRQEEHFLFTRCIFRKGNKNTSIMPFYKSCLRRAEACCVADVSDVCSHRSA